MIVAKKREITNKKNETGNVSKSFVLMHFSAHQRTAVNLFQQRQKAENLIKPCVFHVFSVTKNIEH